MITREDVMSLNSYKNIGFVSQKTLLGKTCMELINHGYNVSKNIGFEKWVETSHPIIKVREVVKELLKNKKK